MANTKDKAGIKVNFNEGQSVAPFADFLPPRWPYMNVCGKRNYIICLAGAFVSPKLKEFCQRDEFLFLFLTLSHAPQ